jgi:hypothetical protein
LREDGCFARQLLIERGANLNDIRQQLGGEPHQYSGLPDKIELHGVVRTRSKLVARAGSLHKFFWERQAFKSRDILREIHGRRVMFYAGQQYDPEKFKLEPGGWKRERCVICGWELFETEGDPDLGVGYTNGLDWMCSECHQKFLASGGPPEDDVYT